MFPGIGCCCETTEREVHRHFHPLPKLLIERKAMAGRWTPSKQSAGFTATCTRSSAIAAAWRTVQEEGDVGYRGKSPEGEQRRCRSSLRRTSPIIILHAPPPAHEKGRETISLTFMAAPNSSEELRGERDVRRRLPAARRRTKQSIAAVAVVPAPLTAAAYLSRLSVREATVIVVYFFNRATVGRDQSSSSSLHLSRQWQAAATFLFFPEGDRLLPHIARDRRRCRRREEVTGLGDGAVDSVSCRREDSACCCHATRFFAGTHRRSRTLVDFILAVLLVVTSTREEVRGCRAAAAIGELLCRGGCRR
nr:hypothetical protein Itr_chr10CG15190 [Ipomoea trifida]